MTLRTGLAGAKSKVNVPEILKGNVKRGGSGTAALTNTLDPTLYPTAPPQSSYKSGVLKIAGSEGGFIGLIVGLGVLIIICVFFVYYILRIRRQRRSNAKRSMFFSNNPLTSRLTRKRGGWVAHIDAFDYESDEDNGLIRTAEVGGAYGAGGKGYTRPPTGLVYSDSRGQHDAYADPFDPEKLPESVHRQQAPLSMKPITTPTNSRNVDGTDAPSRSPPRGYSATDITPTHSPTSPSFEGGTRFKEQF